MPTTVNPLAAVPRAAVPRGDTARANTTRADAARAEPIAVTTALIAPVVPSTVNALPVTPRTNSPRAKSVVITATAPRVTPVVPSIAAVVAARPHGPALRDTLGRAGERGGHHDGERRSGKRTAYVRMHRVFSWSAGNRARDVYLPHAGFHAGAPDSHSIGRQSCTVRGPGPRPRNTRQPFRGSAADLPPRDRRCPCRLRPACTRSHARPDARPQVPSDSASRSDVGHGVPFPAEPAARSWRNPRCHAGTGSSAR
ncbi:hypothetical protein SNOUR_04715 [Streptomyces noursei ATCC 11455]|nr:hypothetical protein SNOUR_04715 [Streptomyces noursei ATCC 11455]